MKLFLKIKKMKIKFLLLFLLLASCGSLNEAGKALRNEKTKTTDEFLIEKRGPLSLPPEMKELPKPMSSSDKKNDSNVLEKNIKKSDPKEKSSLENIFLEEIKKN
tara:strand:+ start:579 stop:893 length:315 start_codon:yes stop_codon:yes gene_type:complete